MIDLISNLRRIQSKNAAETFAQATDSLEAIRDFLTGAMQGLCFYGQIDAIPGANQFTVNNLIGLGDAKFAGANPYYVFVFRDAGGAGAAPQGELRPVTAYVSATGIFTHAAFTAALVAGDEVLIIHPSLISGSLQFIAAGTLDTSSATVPADSTRTEGDNYFNGCILMTIEGAVAYQPRRIVDYTGVGGIFTLDPGNPFTAVSGAVLYVVLADTADFVPAADGALNRTTAEVVGGKADTALYSVSVTASLMRYIKALVTAGIAVPGAVSDAGPAITDFDTDLTEATDNHYNGMLLMFIDGPNIGQAHIIDDYAGAAKNVSFLAGDQWTDVPVNGNSFVILPDLGTLLKALHSVPAADAATNAFVRDVIGNKADAGVVVISAFNSIMAYIKGILTGVNRGFQEQADTAVNINAILAAETDVLNLAVAATRYIVRSLRLKCADPGANTVTVRLYELVNDGAVVVQSFDITGANFGTYLSLMDMFGLPHLGGDNLRVTVQASAAGPYAVTGQYSHATAT